MALASLHVLDLCPNPLQIEQRCGRSLRERPIEQLVFCMRLACGRLCRGDESRLSSRYERFKSLTAGSCMIDLGDESRLVLRFEGFGIIGWMSSSAGSCVVVCGDESRLLS